MKIYTKTGDTGETSLIGGKRVKKNDKRLMIYGEIDALNSYIGLITALMEEDISIKNDLYQIQKQLFILGTEFASSEIIEKFQITENEVVFLEKKIDSISAVLETQKSFIFPGGSVLIAHIHIARTITRRIEREIHHLENTENHSFALSYINRLSDYLFVLARLMHQIKNIPEIYWHF